MKLNISETPNSPKVFLSAEECIFQIKGNSYSEKTDEIFSKIHQWINENFPSLNCEIIFNIYLNVTNSVTYKNILIMMTNIAGFVEKGKKIKIIWKFNSDDEDIRNIGEDIKELFDIPVNIEEVL